MRPYTIARFTILHVSAYVLSLPSKLTNCPTRSILASTISELLTSVKRSGARTMLRGVTFERPPQGSPASRRAKLRVENSPLICLVKSPPSALAQVIPWCIFGPRAPSNLAGAEMASDGWIQLSWWGKSQKVVTRHNLVIGGFRVEP